MESLDLKGLFGGAYDGARVLVTGHTGFKGSWLCMWLRSMGAKVSGLALPPQTSPAHWTLLGFDDIRDLHVDIRDAASVRKAIVNIEPDIVFHLAAQSLVRRGYREPAETFATNIIGLVNVLEAVRSCAATRVVVNATTDKVYQERQTAAGYSEHDALGGNDPYSASKACAELLSDCYRKSYFLSAEAPRPRIATARAGNVIGGGDWSEDRLLPDVVRARAAMKPLMVRNPDAVRPWQHVLESLSGYLRLGQLLLAGKSVEGAWNFGPSDDATLSVRGLLAEVSRYWSINWQEEKDPLNPYEAAILRLDCAKAWTELGWRPVWGVATSIERTLEWYRAREDTGLLLSHKDLHEYVADARTAGLAWTGCS